MSLLNDLMYFYPNYSHFESSGEFVAKEPPASGVTLNEIKFIKGATKFLNLDMKIIIDTTSLYQKMCPTVSKEYEVFARDCDGLAIFESSSKKNIIAAELKSSFSTQDIFKAFAQLVGTIYKTILLLNPLSSFDNSEYHYTGYICTHDHPNRTQALSLISKKARAEMAKGNRYTELALSYMLYSMKEITVTPKECAHLEGFNLSKIGIFDKLTIKLIIVPTGHSTHTISL